ncbi:MAG: GNAT family N-acetyltransferase [Candidatus Diapherotrites archaeon]|nr:GNAT family N-acetyltransferase [Candidatus Diapherotrites archaeon]
MITIKEYSSKYAKSIRDIWVSRSVWGNTAIKKDLTPEEANKKFTMEGTVSFVALKKEKVLGAGRLSLGRGSRSHCAEFVIFVDENVRKLGVGSMLLEEIINAAKKKNISRLELSVFEDNKPAIGLYEKFGFAREGLRMRFLQRGNELFNEVLMAKFL